MNKTSYAPAYPMGAGIESRTMMIYLGVSLVIHLIFIGFMIYLPEWNPQPKLGPSSISVNLVSLPGPPEVAPSPAPAPAPEPPKAAKTAAIPKKEIKETPKAPIIDTPPPKPPPAVPKPKKTVSLAPKKQKFKAKKVPQEKNQKSAEND